VRCNSLVKLPLRYKVQKKEPKNYEMHLVFLTLDWREIGSCFSVLPSQSNEIMTAGN